MVIEAILLVASAAFTAFNIKTMVSINKNTEITGDLAISAKTSAEEAKEAHKSVQEAYKSHIERVSFLENWARHRLP